MKYNRTRRFFLTASAISALTLAACGGPARNAPPVLSEVAGGLRIGRAFCRAT